MGIHKRAPKKVPSKYLSVVIIPFVTIILLVLAVIITRGFQASQELRSQAATAAGHSGIITLLDSQDSWINQNASSTNYGTSKQLSVRHGNQMMTYLSFDLSSLAGRKITFAYLRLHICATTNCGSTGHQNVRLVNESWTENILTYSNHPIVGDVVANFHGGKKDSWIETNILKGVTGKEGSHQISFEIEQAAADGIYIDSKENGPNTQPVLVISYTNGPGVKDMLPTPTPTTTTIPTVKPLSSPTPKPIIIATPVPTQIPSPIPTRMPTPVPTTITPPTVSSDPIIFFNGDLVSSGSLARAQKVVALINTLISQHQGSKILVASTGDNEQEGTPTLSDYQHYFGTTYQTFVNRGIFEQVRGNHDVQDAGHGAAYATYFGSNSHLDSNGLTNYSYNLGTWHIIGLDELNGSVNQNTLSFLTSDLAANTAYKCQIVYWHVPTYSSGSAHGDSVGLKPLNQVEYNAGVDIQINGHDHDYQRFYPINPNGIEDNAKGITTFIDGIGGEDGRSGSKVSIAQAASAVYYDSFLGKEAIGVIMFTLHPTSADYALYDANSGTILDNGSVNCH